MSTAIGVINPTFRNVRSGQLGGAFDILNVKPPELTTSFFTSQTPKPANNATPYQSGYSGYSTPTFQPAQQSGSSLKLNNVFDTSAGLVSQIVSAFGRNQSQQITGSSNVQALVAPQPATPYGSAGQQSPLQTQTQYPQAGGVGASAVNTATGFLDGIAASFGISTTVLMLLGVGGAYLLFKSPPSRR